MSGNAPRAADQGLVFFTIASLNYLAHVRELHASLASAQPGCRFYWFMVDEARGRISEAFPVIEARDIGCAHFFDMAARYDIVELNTAMKPFCFEWLLRETDAQRLVYLDPDVIVLSPFGEVERLFDQGAAIILTPHATAPLDDGRHPDDQQLMQVGSYNLGFCGIRRSGPARAFLDWWGRQLQARCLVEIEQGLFVDQKFCDLVPGLFSDVAILRHPGYNVAYWNLGQRRISRDAAGRWTANDAPLRCMHFSGLELKNPNLVSRHEDRLTFYSIGEARGLFEAYLARMQAAAEAMPGLRATPYAYACLLDGTPITPEMRRVYRRLMPPAPRSREQAFAAEIGRYVTLAPELLDAPGPPVTRLMHEAWLAREPLRRVMALGTASGREALGRWFLANAAALGLPPAIIEATREVLDAPSGGGGRPGLAFSAEAVRPVPHWVAVRSPVGDVTRLDMVGPFSAPTGLGAGARGHRRAAMAAGIEVIAHDIPLQRQGVRPDAALAPAHAPLTADCVVTHINADQAAQATAHIDPRALSRRHRIGYWAWELPNFPLDWLPAFQHVDEVWVPSRFVAEAIAARAVKPVHVIPHPIAPPPPVSQAAARQRLGLPADRLIFLAAFDLASHGDRENPDGTLRAFMRAFPEGKNGPLLCLKLQGLVRRDKRLTGLLREAMARPDVIVIDRTLDEAEMDALRQAVDVLVSLHRSDGFGLWIAEAMACGKTCIVTDHAGPRDFCDAANALLVPHRLREVRLDEYPFAAGQRWAEPDADAAVTAMLMASEPGLRERLGAAARAVIAERYSPAAVGAMMRRRLYAARAEMLSLGRLLVQGRDRT